MTTAREIQRNYRKIFDLVKKTKEPVVVMRNNKPEVVIMDPKKLSEMQAILDVLESREEARTGKMKELKSFKDLR
ncbi:type II toxin-antitoxin system Phd/YefM family antitoxin [Patescibacteria group bacterium]|nr:type II toxin-antitoxin system Phd/YefM family antitoxin [Patescibacteria group bacterium]